MAVWMRAVVMLVVLVGLPAAWVYYGPLPPGAQRVVDRAVEVSKKALGWGQPSQFAGDRISAPHYGQVPADAPSYSGQTIVANLSDATVPSAPSAERANTGETRMPRQVESLLEQLRSLGVAEYTLEKWGINGQLYRFRCAMPLAQSDEFTRQFEAVASAPLASIEQVVGEVASWRTARLDAQRLR